MQLLSVSTFTSTAGFEVLPVNMMKTYMTNWLKVTKIDKNNKQNYNNISAMLLSTVGQFGNISLWKF